MAYYTTKFQRGTVSYDFFSIPFIPIKGKFKEIGLNIEVKPGFGTSNDGKHNFLRTLLTV